MSKRKHSEVQKTSAILKFKSSLSQIEIGRAQIENFGPIWNFLTQYIFCRSRQDKSFDGIMTIFHYVEKFLKNFESWENSWKGTLNLTTPDTGGLTTKSQNWYRNVP